MDARRGDEHVPETGTARRPDAADAEFGRNPKGREVLIEALRKPTQATHSASAPGVV